MEQVHYELQGQSLIVYVTKELDHHAVINLRATSGQADPGRKCETHYF